jgi:hypothetical protein
MRAECNEDGNFSYGDDKKIRLAKRRERTSCDCTEFVSYHDIRLFLPGTETEAGPNRYNVETNSKDPAAAVYRHSF